MSKKEMDILDILPKEANEEHSFCKSNRYSFACDNRSNGERAWSGHGQKG